MKNKKENIFITWHYSTHGIAYLKHILSAFHQKGVEEKDIKWRHFSQTDLQAYFDRPQEQGFVFDKVYYLTVEQPVIQKIADRRKYREEMLRDAEVEQAGLREVWHELLGRQDVRSPDYEPDLDADLAFVQANFQDQHEAFMRLLWRDVQHYTIEDQVKWFEYYSNARSVYGGRMLAYESGVKNLRDAKEITRAVEKFLEKIKKDHPHAQLYINISLGSSETQVAWHALSQAGRLPVYTRFFQTYDVKSEGMDKRFKNIIINEVPPNLFEVISLPAMYSQTQSEKRKLAELLMQHHINTGFSILIFGERGTGKSFLAKRFAREAKFVEANCASFADDNMAESALFGHEKGAFTDAKDKKDGLFQQAKDGILFLDEVHHLSKRVQEKLMKAIQTDDDNNFKIRRLGSNKEEVVSCRLIFATNRSVDELRNSYLHEDFFDRIAQNCLHIPPLRETPEDREEDWRTIWAQLKFGSKDGAPNDKPLISWLQQLPLYGNFRDLQKIALFYHNFNEFDSELRKLLGQSTALEYAKSEFAKLQSKADKTENPYFDTDKSIKKMEVQFKQDLAKWAIGIFGTAEKAAQHFRELGDKTTHETLYRWKNEDS